MQCDVILDGIGSKFYFINYRRGAQRWNNIAIAVIDSLRGETGFHAPLLQHFPGDIFKYPVLNEDVYISIKISLKFVPKGPINNIPPLVQIMAWCRPGDRALSESVIVSLLILLSV